MRTGAVKKLVNEVIGSLPQPFSEDVIDDAFHAIESNAVWRREYNELCNELGKPWLILGVATGSRMLLASPVCMRRINEPLNNVYGFVDLIALSYQMFKKPRPFNIAR